MYYYQSDSDTTYDEDFQEPVLLRCLKQRIFQLSKPKLYRPSVQRNYALSEPITKVNRSAKEFIPSTNLLKLSQPKELTIKWSPPEKKSKSFISLPHSVLNYEPSKRIIDLASPRRKIPKFTKRKIVVNNICVPSSVSTKALNYRPSSKIKSLAIPRKIVTKYCERVEKDKLERWK